MQLKNRLNPEYRKGVQEFLQFAFAHVESGGKILCPCVQCNNCYWKTRDEVDSHLLVHGIIKNYIRWTHHGEEFEYVSNDGIVEDQQGEETIEDIEDADIQEMIHDIATGELGDTWLGDDSTNHQDLSKDEGEADTFAKLFREAKQKLYPDCENFSKLSFVVKLLHIKIMNNWTHKSFNMTVQLLKAAFPHATLPGSYDEAKKLIRDLGLNYVKIHVCEYDCAIFWNEYKDWDKCPICKTSRWKFEGSKKIPRKVLRYFPLKPRLQRLFVNKNIVEDMRWHKEKRVNEDNVIRHPADSEAWKEFDEAHKSFAEDPRNVRLGLASNGFNPFGNLSNAYSMWPVIIVPYNLLPWKCMKDPFFFMSMLIPGPKSPGNDIDVFLRPLIDELKELW